MIKQAASRGVRSALLNPDAVPGKANRFLARRAEAIFAQFESTAACFPPRLRGRIRAVGCPIRGEFLRPDRQAGIRELHLRPDRRTLLVCGGSSGARSVNDALLAIAPDLDAAGESWQVLHVTGEGKARAANLEGKVRRLAVRSVEYCQRMDLALAAADLVLCRAGASTIAELCAVGAAAVILPYPYHRDQHQRLNAEALEKAGAAVVVEDRIDPAANAASLRQALLPLLADTARLDAMRRASAALGKPRAAEEVARWLAGRSHE
jgi:UDP-N-acetylglucosamine--N-acetylmuramyl-(pentapeptide) pyrophosphoryl-undecaprenol N-acetylglucosamine transferase